MKNLPIAGIRIQQAFLSVWKSNKFCVVRESNPGQLLGRQLWYHFTNNALSILSRQWRPLLSLPPLRQQASFSLFWYLTVRWRRLSVTRERERDGHGRRPVSLPIVFLCGVLRRHFPKSTLIAKHWLTWWGCSQICPIFSPHLSVVPYFCGRRPLLNQNKLIFFNFQLTS